MKYNNITLGLVEAVFNKLGGEEGIRLFLSGAMEIVAKKDVIKESFPIFLDISVGGMTGQETIVALKKASCTYYEIANILKSNSWAAGHRGQVQFSKATPHQLGFAEDFVLYEEVIKRIESFGYRICEPYDGPAICLALATQPPRQRLYVAVSPKAVTRHGAVFVLGPVVHGHRKIEIVFKELFTSFGGKFKIGSKEEVVFRRM